MDIVLADIKDASIIHMIMLQAFKEYAHATPPSSALSETVASIEQALSLGEQAFISYIKGQPVAMVRFKENDEGMYFFRLSVIPEQQGQGLAKALIVELESYARTQGKKYVNVKFA